ncbi:hypothetical protein KIN20_025480 [Parelaphostrongylus tenuis]|uniref:Uncharacterized protein n=1 Tax=Parelaphostrongylus tenuis TaxID=148309 RepID=A0AAD5MZJ3_PARTN|nr:hypothetical protein KIN20_025480 [Parelaphostrongylus tenuis]
MSTELEHHIAEHPVNDSSAPKATVEPFLANTQSFKTRQSILNLTVVDDEQSNVDSSIILTKGELNSTNSLMYSLMDTGNNQSNPSLYSTEHEMASILVDSQGGNRC